MRKFQKMDYEWKGNPRQESKQNFSFRKYAQCYNVSETTCVYKQWSGQGRQQQRNFKWHAWKKQK